MGQFAPSNSDTAQYVVPTTGSTVVCANSTTLLLLNPASVLATLTVTLPPNPVDGQRFVMAAGALITLLTINGGTVKGLITTLSLNGYARFAYSVDANAWFRTG